MADFSSPSRRSAVTSLIGASVAVWATPAITTWDAVAAATGSDVAAITGQVTIATLSPGDSLLPSSTDYSSNSTMYVFSESQTTLTSPLATDSGLTVPVGVVIQSYLIHLSTVTGNNTFSGTVTVPGTIVGWDWTNNRLVNGDSDFGCPGVTYGSRRRSSEPGSNDSFSVNTSTGVVDLTSMYVASAFVDQIRVYVQI